MKRKLTALTLAAALTLAPTTASALDEAQSLARDEVVLDHQYTMYSTANLKGTWHGDTLVVTGVSPLRTASSFSGISEVCTGHFMGLATTRVTGVGDTMGILNQKDAPYTDNKALKYGTMTDTVTLGSAGTTQLALINMDYAPAAISYDYATSGTAGTKKPNSSPPSAAWSALAGKTGELYLDTSGVIKLDQYATARIDAFATAVADLWGKSTTAGTAWNLTATDLNTEPALSKQLAAIKAYNALTSSDLEAITSAPKIDHDLNYHNLLAMYSFGTDYENTVAKLKDLVKRIGSIKPLPATINNLADAAASLDEMIALESEIEALPQLLKTAADTADTKLAGMLAAARGKVSVLFSKLFKQAESINLNQPLTEESTAILKDIVTCVDSKYLTDAQLKGIKGYSDTKYHAMTVALEKSATAAHDVSNGTVELTDKSPITYTGKQIRPTVKLSINGTPVPEDCYTVTYDGSIDCGTATVTLIGVKSKGYTGTQVATYTIAARTLSPSDISIATSATYNGSSVRPAVTVPDSRDCAVSYKNNTAVGQATVTVTGTGNYTGTVSKSFIIKPTKVSGLKTTAGSKKTTISYTAQKGAKYKIVCKPTKGATKTVYTSATKKTVTGLKAGTYKVYVRAYANIGGTTYYGSYATKSVRVK